MPHLNLQNMSKSCDIAVCLVEEESLTPDLSKSGYRPFESSSLLKIQSFSAADFSFHVYSFGSEAI